MYFACTDIGKELQGFQLQGMSFPYSRFAARLYNYCRSLGFESGKILPSRAFCSDENQGYPIILLTKHFGAFPFNHGRVGGIVAIDRHGPHAHHGQDLVIVHASHVGFDPHTGRYGVYRRVHTEHMEITAACGKIEHVLAWYQEHYAFAQENIRLHRYEGELLVTIDNALLDDSREGLVLHLDRLIAGDGKGRVRYRHSSSTAKSYVASQELRTTLGDIAWPETGHQAIGSDLQPQWFHFQRSRAGKVPEDRLEANLLPAMPWIVASPSPLLTAAQANVQVEFDRTYRSLITSDAYRGKRLLFVSGLHIDCSPPTYQAFPVTRFVPWAAFVQDRKGSGFVLDQPQIVARLQEQAETNPDELHLEQSIAEMTEAENQSS